MFRAVHSAAQRARVLESYKLGAFGDRLPIAIDGTGPFGSTAVRCPQCGVKRRSKGKAEYYHLLLAAVMLSPDVPEVLPKTLPGSRRSTLRIGWQDRLATTLGDLVGLRLYGLIIALALAAGLFLARIAIPRLAPVPRDALAGAAGGLAYARTKRWLEDRSSPQPPVDRTSARSA